MPDYAVLLYFEPQSEQKVRRLQEAACRSSGNTYIFDNEIHPHVTLSLFTRDHYEDLFDDLAEFASRLHNVVLVMSSIGIFRSTTSVVSLFPVLSENLAQIHADLRDILDGRNCEFHAFYERPRWVPHCSLAVSVTFGQLMQVLGTVCDLYDEPIKCRAASLVLTECEPCREIMRWPIL